MHSVLNGWTKGMRSLKSLVPLLVVALGSTLPGLAQTTDGEDSVIYDLLLKNGHVIDPQNGRNSRMDVAIVGRKIYKIGEDLPASRARKVVDLTEYYVTPGLIDIHGHFDQSGAWLNLNPDHNTLRYGVTTAVDAGSSGYKGFEKFKKETIDEARVRLLAFLNIVGAGMYGPDVENDVAQMDVDAAVAMVKKYPDVIVGIKTAHYAPADWEAVDRAVKASELSNSVLMVDFHPKEGRGYEDLILEHMKPGNIHTHFYGRLTPQLDANKRVEDYMWKARERGVLFDVGHGSGSFWFRIAVPAIKQGFLPDTISTDLHKSSVMLPRAHLNNVMSKFLNIGMTLEQVIERTTVNPAKAIRRTDLGRLEEGGEADIAVLKVEEGKFAFLDSGHGKLTGNKNITCAMTLRAGRVIWDAEGISMPEWTTAGPYSNYK
ncbi:MAG: amidohydrolase/deacetylase family metallohydrolase [Acidobacteria bacterium]|nr:amidohydrolase/deacetylase family metallohydrolase [Acidobacteriota bacterium]